MKKNTSLFSTPLFSTTRPSNRKSAVAGGRQAYLEALESRQLLSVTLTYGGAGTALTLTESVPGATNIKISEVSANVLRVDLNGSDFDVASTAAGGLLSYEGASPDTSTFADIDISGANAITTVNATLTGDLVSIGSINNATGGVGNLTIAGNQIQVLAASTVDTTHATNTGSILLTSTTSLKVQAGAAIHAKDGAITLTANQANAAGNFNGVDITGATITTTGTGNILLQGNGSNDASTGSHIGVKISNAAGTGSVITTSGTGNITIIGNGGTGTTGNSGVNITGATINGVNGLAITGTGGQGADSDVGVAINGLNAANVTTPGLLQITGTGGGTGGATNESGVSLTNSAFVLATGTGSIDITGTAGTGAGNGITVTTAANVIAANGTLTLTADSMQLSSTPTFSGITVLLQPKTAGTQIDIGGTSSTGVLGLNALAIDGILGTTLQIGNASAGAMTISGTIVSPGPLAIKLVNNGAITETGSLTTPALAIQSAGPVSLGGNNNVNVLAANVTGSLNYNNAAPLTIGTADGITGISAGSSAVVTASTTINVNEAINATAATVRGSGGNDTFTIQKTGNTTLTLDGLGGTNAYIVNLGQLQSSVNVGATAGTNTLTANGTASANTFGIAEGIMVWNAAEFVTFSNLQQVVLQGGAASDWFNVTPTIATPVSLVGNDPTPPTAPGDFLNLLTTGTAGLNANDTLSASGHSGSFSFSNRQNVTYSGLETVPVVKLNAGSAQAITVVEGNSTGAVPLAYFTDSTNSLPASAYTATVNWGDGSAAQTAAVSFDASIQTFTVKGTHTYPSPGIYHPTITITSSAGISSDTINETAIVSAIPIVGTGKTLSGTEGQTVSTNVASFTTTRTAAAAADYTASINWGDGKTTTGTVVKDSAGHFHVNGSHAYGDQSTGAGFRVTVTVSRTGASDTVISSTATMAGVAIDSPSSRTATAAVNVQKTFVLGTFRDKNAVNTNAGAYIATIAWGDGTSSLASFVLLRTSSAGSIWQVRAPHKYTSAGTFKPVIRIHDVANKNQVLVINDTITVS
ncbi:MAG: beta strand repeat-containing protein [Phycisphaerae bacterium]